MAGKKENLKALFSNTRSRVIIVFTAVILFIAVTVGFIKFSGIGSSKLASSSDLSSAPGGIQSIPGSMDQTAQYAALQQAQNIQQAATASKTGGSAIPTIIRAQAFGNGVQPIGPQNGVSGVGFQALSREDTAGPQQSLWLQSLKDSDCSKSTINSVVSQGAVINDLKGACSCIQLKDFGYKFDDLRTVCSCKELKSAGYNARQMKDAGFTAGKLRLCGFDACELRAAGFTVQEMKDGGYSDGELKGAGYPDNEVGSAGGLPDGIAADDVLKAGCQVDDLKKLKEAGVTASAIRRINGCSAEQLKAAGFSTQDLKNAGFSAADLLKAGFNPSELKRAGFSARDLLDAGVSPADLTSAGYTNAEVKAAEGELPPGMTSDNVKEAGCNVEALKRERLAGVSALLIRKYAGCSAQALKDAGYTNDDLANAGFTPAEIKTAQSKVDDPTIKAAGCQPSQLKTLYAEGVSASRIRQLNGCSAAALKAAGYNAGELSSAGFAPQELAAAGFSPAEINAVDDNAVHSAGCDPQKLHALFLNGVTAKHIHDLNGCNAAALKAAGFNEKELENAGFTPAEIKAAQLNVDASAIKAAGCQPSQLKILYAEGVSASRIRELNGCSAAALKAAGYNAGELSSAGFAPQELAAAGFSPAEINAVDDNAVHSAGCDPQKLHALLLNGVTAKHIHDLNGCSASALKTAGFDAKQLADAGFTPDELAAAGITSSDLNGQDDNAVQRAGCDPQKLHALFLEGVTAKRIHDLNGCGSSALKSAGFDAKDLANAGFTPQELLSAGFTPEQLNEAGLNPAGIIAAGRNANCSVDSLKAAHALGVSALTIKQTLGCNAKQMKQAGYSAAELNAAGFTAADLKDAGFSAAELKNAGFSAKDLRSAGFTAQDLKNAGFTPEQLKEAGYAAADLKNAGFSAEQLKAAGFSVKDLKEAGFNAGELKAAGYSAKDLKKAGFSASQLKQAGFSPAGSNLAGLEGLNELENSSSASPIPSIDGSTNSPSATSEASNAKQLQEILKRQQTQMADQQHQQKIQQRMSAMLGAANDSLQSWKSVATQTYITGTPPKNDKSLLSGSEGVPGGLSPSPGEGGLAGTQSVLIKSGDVLFAVLDTSVNSDEPGPILATIVSGKYKGSKLIGSFTLPSNADKMVINFNTMSVPGAPKTTTISAYAIDPNTARTALASKANHHYLLRYGSLFASSFLEGIGNAFQSANTTVTIGGTGGTNNTTISNGAGRSVLENAVIGLATLGKTWGQVAQQKFNTPTTVLLCSGTGIGILFTQDLASL